MMELGDLRDRIVSQVLLLAYKWASGLAGLTAIDRFQPSFPIGETAVDEQRTSRIQDRRGTQHAHVRFIYLYFFAFNCR